MLQHFCGILSNAKKLAQSYVRCFTTFNMTTNVVFYTSRL